MDFKIALSLERCCLVADACAATEERLSHIFCVCSGGGYTDRNLNIR
jgi:hypothetical protein